MSEVPEEAFGLIEKLRLSAILAQKIVQKGELHAEPRDLRGALNCEGSTVQGVLKNWIYDLIDTEPELLHDKERAERFVTRALREKLLQQFPGACES